MISAETFLLCNKSKKHVPQRYATGRCRIKVKIQKHTGTHKNNNTPTPPSLKPTNMADSEIWGKKRRGKESERGKKGGERAGALVV